MAPALSSYAFGSERNTAIARRLAAQTGGLGYLAAKDAVDPDCIKEREKRDAKKLAKLRAQRGLAS
jgi:hypothetical protein